MTYAVGEVRELARRARIEEEFEREQRRSGGDARVLREGRVVDFLNVGVGPVRTGIFNFADVAILGGVLFLAAQTLRRTDPATRAAS